MRGARIEAFGEPTKVLELVDEHEPAAPAAGEVLVGVEYAPVNMNDLYVIQGVFPVRPSLPSFVGNEGVGRVLALGGGVEHLKVGDRILIPLYAFSWRERLVVPAAGLFRLPDTDPKQLAMLGINPPTASLLLDEASDLRPGDWIVQNAANSGVGRSVIAIAKARGLKTINVVRRPELIPELEAIGADFVIVDEDGSIDKIHAAVGDDRVQLAIDGVAGKSSALIAGALTAHGTFVVYAYMSGGLVTISPFELIVKRVIARGFFMNHADIEPKIPAALREAVPLVASGAIHVPIAAVYPLSSLREAVLHAERGGKVLLELGGAD
ncbi:zinc-dependent alcohol dehydrogenase family protein [Bradyrhizobium sp. NP1]|uniref:zinc-dependent alcohol dehydrogenase family protein n=1 Tax=Bradyrhizobium sp. NP1 TaxID=3049772 RepID=UPI0025A5DF6A|nr:zinc-dependent alcohol dehydrogenase family protein [Bradyrhizobium sp. NP1]WJR75551.1 zinc-dependent alcohol dehydrogenase family protein [Bradyrhizobium sp. NP1]